MSTVSAVISFQSVSYAAAGAELVRGLSLDIHEGETFVLLGRSGAGKTTTLKLVNRLLEPTSGEVRVNGIATLAWDPIQLRRKIGYAIQDVGLFPHFTVERNIALVPELQGWEQTRIRDRVAELLILVGLSPEIATRYPRELSGGQRQRVGVARALGVDPPILLMDEPFGALDPLTRAELQRGLQELQKRLRKTILFVTHDLREALLLGSRIGLMESGELAVVATPAEFRNSHHPLAEAYLSAFGSKDGSVTAPEGSSKTPGEKR